MHFDRLDEIYAVLKYNWHFEHVSWNDLTSWGERSDRSGLLNRPYGQLLIRSVGLVLVARSATFDYDYTIQMSILIIFTNSSS
jgi:hypothetical protein